MTRPFRYGVLLAALFSLVTMVRGQSLAPSMPAKELIYFGDRLLAVDVASIPVAVSVSPRSGSGDATFTFTFSDPNGYADLDVVNILMNDVLDGNNACYLAYSRPSSTLYLLTDGGALGTGYTLSSSVNLSGTPANSQCTITSGSMTESGQTTTIVLGITFKAAFTGSQVIYMAARDLEDNNSGWQPLGVRDTASPDSRTVSVSPSQGSGPGPTAFVATYRGTSSYAEFTTTWLLINDQIDGVGACYIAYSEASDALYLVHDNGSSLLAANPQGSGHVENSQCVLENSGTSVVKTGTDIVVTAEITFKTPFEGPRILYMGAALDAGGGTGWHAKGAWTVQE